MDELPNNKKEDPVQFFLSCPFDHFNTSELLPFFLDSPDDDYKVSPSALNKELLMPLEERLEQLSRPTRKRRSFTEKYILSANPDVVVFQNFVSHQVCKASVTFQNMHKVSKRLKVRKKTSPYFHLEHLENNGPKIAPGMIYTVTVVFCPVELRNYTYEISVVTEDGELTVPVYGLGLQPILNAPDRITMPPTPVRVPSVKTVILHNFGQVNVKYVAHCQGPFQVTPTRNCIKPSDAIELQVTCLPTRQCSKITGEITFTYDTLTTTVIVECEIIDADIFFENPNVTFDEVYIGLKSHKTLTFTNRSDYTLSFCWKSYDNFDERKMKTKLINDSKNLLAIEKMKYVPLEYNNVINCEGHAMIWDKKMENTEPIDDEMQLYTNKNFTIIPLEGQIIPRQKFDFVVIFSPNTVGCIESCAHFDVTGLTERIEVNFSGEALGPKVVLNVKLLDLNDIFLNASYDYEILVKNIGQIGATVVFEPTETNFGGVIHCIPKKQIVHFNGDCKLFTLRFSSQSKGYFIETINFRIAESDEIVSCLIKGNVQCPLLQSNVCAIDFGKIPCGIEELKCFNIINRSQVEIDYSIKLEDKTLVTHYFVPDSGILKPFSDTPVKLTISPNEPKNVTTSLTVYSWGEKEMSLRLPVSFQSNVAIIECCPEEINIPFCFIGYRYTRSIKLKNVSDILGIVTYCRPTTFPEGFSCTLDKTDLSLKPLEEAKIKLTILATKIGTFTYPLHFIINSFEAKTICKVICDVSGPVISVEPMELNLGSIPLLKEHVTQLKLTNESPIPANLTVNLAPETCLTVDLHEFVFAPENDVVITVKCYLTCNGKFRETIDIKVENGEQIKVIVSAYGTGHSILVYPELYPEYDLKTVLTYEECKLPVTFENLGKKSYRVMLTQSSELPRTLKPTMSPLTSVFDIQPNYFELFPHKTVAVEIRGFTKRPKYVFDDFYCYILPDKARKPVLFMSFIMKANFIEPTVNFSEEKLRFQVGYHEDIVDKDVSNLTIEGESVDVFRHAIKEELVETTETQVIQGIKHDDIKSVILQNILDVNVSMVISTSEHFYIQIKGQLFNQYEVVLLPHTILQINLCFKPDIEAKRYLSLRGYLEVHFHNHPKTESLILSGEIWYPTINIPEQYDFGCIAPGSYSKTSIIIVNVTVPPAQFKWHFVESEYEIENLPDVKIQPSLQSLNPSSIDSKLCGCSVCSYENSSQTVAHVVDSSPVPVSSSLSKEQKNATLLISTKSEVVNQVHIITSKSRKEASQITKLFDSEQKIKESSLEVLPSSEIQNEIPTTISKTEVAKLLSPLITDEGDEEEFFKCPKQTKQTQLDPYDWRNVFSIEPWNGVLEAHEHSAISLSFTPPPNVRVKAVFECVSEGGQAERMVVKGICSSVYYKFDKEYLEFGHRIYNDICEGELTLTNIGYGYINANVICDPPMDSPTTKWLNVTPAKDRIAPGDKLVFTVRYYPGITGEFRKQFKITIEYLEPISFYVHGYAKFSQVTASMHRPGMEWYDTDLTYKVIDNISEKYLQSLVTYEIRSSLGFADLPDDLPTADLEWLKSNDWEVLSKHEICPSAREIELSLERMLFNAFLLTNSPRVEFTVPHYMLDFGPTVVSSAVILTVPLLNNGPIPTYITVTKSSSNAIAKDEFKLQLIQSKIEVGSTQKMNVLFMPTRKRYGSEDQHVENMFELKVANGAKIPVYVKAIVTLPRVKIQCKTVFFEDVHLGQALRRSIVMRNDGFVASNWSTELVSSDKTFKKNFMVIPNSGRLEPKQCALLNIYFIPIQIGDIVSTLNLYVEQNAKKTVLKLRATGSEAVLMVDSPFLKFKSILPFTSTYNLVNVQNMSSFPVEYCFPDLDPKFKEEKCLIDAYLLYNKLKMVLLPRMEPGTTLPTIFNENYHFLKNKINRKLSDSKSDEYEETQSDLSIKDEFKHIKSYINLTLTENDTCATENLFDDDDPTSYIKIIDREEENKIIKKGTVIVFHGGPSTDYYKISNKVGIAFSIPVYSLDKLIYEEILANECPAANNFNRDLDNYLMTVGIHLELMPDEDDYEFLIRKYHALTNFTSPSKKRDSTKPELTIELITSLLQAKLKRLPNLIIESLNSHILHTAMKALDALNILTQYVQYTHLILLNCTWQNYCEIIAPKEEYGYKRTNSIKSTKTASSIRSTRSAPSTPSITGSLKKVKLSKSSNVILVPQINKNEFDSYHRVLEHILQYGARWNNIQVQNSITKDLTQLKRVSSKASTIKNKSITEVNDAIPMWVFNTTLVSDWEHQCNTIITLLKQNTEFLNALNNNVDQKSIFESSAQYTVLTRSHWKERARSDVFDIDYVDAKHTEAESNLVLIRKRKSSTKGPLGKIQFFTPRTVISPGEVIAYKVLFLPKTCGTYRYDFRIETIGVNHTYEICCDAKCQLPKIDFTPAKVFPNVLDSIGLKSLHDNFVYVKDNNTFYFGPILVGSAKTPPYKTTFRLTNNSKTPCKISTYIDEHSLYSCKPSTATLAPQSSDYLHISVKSTKKGLLQSDLYITVMDNPKVFVVKLYARPCPIDISIIPMSLEFEMVPLNFCLKKKMQIKNNSLVNLWWKVGNTDALKKSFKISPTSGALKAYSIEDIDVEYKSNVEENIKMNLEILIFDMNCSNVFPFYTENILLHANAVEYAMNYNNHIMLGDIKAKHRHKGTFHMFNKGKFSINIRVEEIVDKNDRNKSIRQNFQLKPLASDVIPPEKGCNVEFYLEISKEVKLEKVPIFVCNILDGNKPESTVLNTFFIYVSARVYLSKYEICPSSAIYFGYQQILSTEVRKVTIKNLGRFPFYFSIRFKNARATSQSQLLGSNVKKRVDTPRSKSKVLLFSCFSITPVHGEVSPGHSVELSIECTPEEAQEYKETMVLQISESYKDAFDEIDLFVNGAEPHLDFKNTVPMFNEHFIVKNLADYFPPDKIAAHSIYVTTEQTLYFSRVCINSNMMVKVYLTNIGHVTARVTIVLKERSNPFFIFPTVLNIDPMRMEIVYINFKPISIGTAKNTMEIAYNKTVNNIFQLDLVGKCCVPQIKVLEPELDSNSAADITLPLTCIHEKQSTRISIQNIGEIPCKVILDLRNNSKKLFNVEICEDSVQYLNMNVPELRNFTDSSLLNLKSSEIANFDINYCSQEETYEEITLKIHTANNPFEIFNITVKAQTYDVDISIKGLPTSIDEDGVVMYSIDFGGVFLNTFTVKHFTLMNNSKDKIYKFEFSTFQNLWILPKVGHIKPGQRKEIVTAAASAKAVTMENVKMELECTEIEYVNPDTENDSWDDRRSFPPNTKSEIMDKLQDIIYNATSTMKLPTLLMSEPEVRYVDKEQMIIPISLSLNINYASYKCEIQEIIFPTTYVLETSTFEFEIENTGYIPVNIEWMFECMVSKENSSPTQSIEQENDSRLYPSTMLYSVPHLPEKPPFSIEPKKCTIPTRNSTNFVVTFSPISQSVYCYVLTSKITCLNPSLKELEIEVMGESKMSKFYFEIGESSDIPYVPKSNGSDEEDVKIISFESVGVGTVCTKVCNLVNCYEEYVTFTFEPEPGNTFPSFSCKNPTGTMEPVKKFQVVFKFIPSNLGRFEEKYTFSMEGKPFKTTFILIGTCKEATVFFTTPHVTLPSTIAGADSKGQLVIRNEESITLGFKILKESLTSFCGDEELVVSPMNGKIPAKSDVVINLTYNAKTNGSFNFLMKCALEKTRPISASVFASCLEIKSMLWYFKEGKKFVIRHHQENVVNLGNLPLRKSTGLQIIVQNMGDVGFYYKWNLLNKDTKKYVNVTLPEQTYVERMSDSTAFVYFEPVTKKEGLTVRISIEISNGRTYLIQIQGSAKSALCKFSFTTYNFHYCTVQKKNSKRYYVELYFQNLERSPVLVENEFENNADLTVALKSAMVSPRTSLNIPIYFHPQKPGLYKFDVPLTVDSSNYSIKIKGEGVLPNIQLYNVKEKCVDLGKIKVGTVKKFTIHVVNRSLAVTRASFNTKWNLPSQKLNMEISDDDDIPVELPRQPKKPKVKKSIAAPHFSMETSKLRSFMSRKSGDTIQSQTPSLPFEESSFLKDWILVNPTEPIEMQINKKYELVCEFQAKERLPRFSEKIFYDADGTVEALCVIKGSCIAPLYYLDKKVLTFTNIVIGNKSSQQVLLVNKGDINGTYNWTFETITDMFSINPTEGFLPQNSKKVMTVTFAPTTIQCQNTCKLLCHIPNSPTLELFLTGNSIGIPKPISKLKFSCAIGGEDAASVPITNGTNTPWIVMTKHSTDLWVVPKQIEIPIQACSSLEISFLPTYSPQESVVKDTLCLEFPNGQVQVYELEGTILPPAPTDKIYREVPCKTWYTEVLTIENNINAKRCYSVTTNLLGNISHKSIYKVDGLEMIEVLPNSSKQYSWRVYIYNEIHMQFKVIFTSINSSEETFFDIQISGSPALPLATLCLTTSVRKRVNTSIKLNNPLNAPVKFNTTCDIPEITFEKTITANEYTGYNLQINYFPLVSGIFTGKLEAKSDELGSFIYTLKLIAKPPPLEEKMTFEAELGEKCTSFSELRNVFETSLDLVARFDNPTFSMEKPLVVLPGRTGKFYVTFEPNNIGVFQATATLTSLNSGDYTYPLIGKCTPPTPKGPIHVKSDGTTFVIFRNPFPERYKFIFDLTSTHFSVNPQSDNIDSKRRLIITCDHESKKDVKWIYYLQSYM